MVIVLAIILWIEACSVLALLCTNYLLIYLALLRQHDDIYAAYVILDYFLLYARHGYLCLDWCT